MKKKLSQKQIAFMYLFAHRGQWISPWDIMGNLNIYEKRFFGSYKMASRLSDLAAELPISILDRKLVIGVSGAKYFVYRMPAHIKLSIYDLINNYYRDLILLYRKSFVLL